MSVSVGQGQMNNYGTMLSWNISAPCRLTGEVWPCKKENSCREISGYRQQLANGTWKQNSTEQWVRNTEPRTLHFKHVWFWFQILPLCFKFGKLILFHSHIYSVSACPNSYLKLFFIKRKLSELVFVSWLHH